MKISFITGYLLALGSPTMMRMAVRVALIVGSILFIINHGTTLIQGKMTSGRWISALLTFCVPYAVSIHGQYVAQQHPHHSARHGN